MAAPTLKEIAERDEREFQEMRLKWPEKYGRFKNADEWTDFYLAERKRKWESDEDEWDGD